MTDFLIDDGKNKIEGLSKEQINAELSQKVDNESFNAAVEELENAIIQKANTDYVDEEIARIEEIIDDLPEPMIFKGTLGTGGTIETLPNASASNEGFTYKVITAGTYAGQSARVGDVFISNATEWVLVPAGDDFNDTWRAIKVNGTEVLNNAISSGAVNFNEGEQITITFDAETKTLNFNVVNTYTKQEVDDLIYDVLPDGTANGAIAKFETSLSLPIKSMQVDVNAVQEAGTPTPAAPLPISGWSEISLTKCGKNLLNVLPLIDDDYYALNSDGSLKILQTDNRGWNSVSVITRLKKGTYTLSRSLASGYCDVRTSLDNYASGNVMGLSATSKTFTLSDDADIKVKFGYGLQSGYPFNCFFNISVGSSATPYEPFNGNTEVINLGGTYYGGHFTQDKDGHRQFVVTYNYLDIGSTTWNSSADGYTQNKVDITDMKPAPSGNTKANFLCSSYKTDSPSNVYNKVENSTIAIATNQRIRVYDTRLIGMTGQQVQETLTGVYIAYEMVTPIVIDLPDGEPINTLNGINNFYADSGDTTVIFKQSVNDAINAAVNSANNNRMLGIINMSKGNESEEKEKIQEDLIEESNEK